MLYFYDAVSSFLVNVFHYNYDSRSIYTSSIFPLLERKRKSNVLDPPVTKKIHTQLDAMIENGYTFNSIN